MRASDPASSASAAAWISIPATISGLRPTPVRPVPGPDLAHRPDAGIEPGDQSDLSGAGAAGGEEERDQAPGQGVVQVVDQPRLGAGAKGGLAVGGVRKGPTERRRLGVRIGVIAGLLERHVVGRVADEEEGDE